MKCREGGQFQFSKTYIHFIYLFFYLPPRRLLCCHVAIASIFPSERTDWRMEIFSTGATLHDILNSAVALAIVARVPMSERAVNSEK